MNPINVRPATQPGTGPTPSLWPVAGTSLGVLERRSLTAGDCGEGCAVGGPPLPGGEDFRFAAALANRDAQNFMRRLEVPWPQAGSVILYRHVPGAGGSGPQRSCDFPLISEVNRNQPAAAYPSLVRCFDFLVDEWSYAEVPATTKAMLFRGPNFTGDTVVLAPGSYNLNNMGWGDQSGPHSMIVLPNIDVDGTVKEGLDVLQNLASPENGCAINVNNYDTHPAVLAFVRYLDRVIAMFGPTPMAREFELRKNQLLTTLARGVLANRAACGDGGAAAAPGQRTVCPAGTQQLQAADLAGMRAQGYTITLVQGINKQRGCFKVEAPGAAGAGKVCIRRWSGKTGNFSNQGPFCITDPAVAQCEARGGYLQANLNRRDTPVLCLPRGAQVDVQSYVPGQGMVPGGFGISAQNLGPYARPQGQAQYGQQQGQYPQQMQQQAPQQQQGGPFGGFQPYGVGGPNVNEQVVFYKHAKWDGAGIGRDGTNATLALGLGNYADLRDAKHQTPFGQLVPAGDWSDLISAIDVPAGVTLRAFEHVNFGGAMKEFVGPMKLDFVGADWNDRISSVQVLASLPVGLSAHQRHVAHLAAQQHQRQLQRMVAQVSGDLPNNMSYGGSTMMAIR